MTLGDATAGFLDSLAQDSSVRNELQSNALRQALKLLTEFFSPTIQPCDISPIGLRDFLARWYLERACTSLLSISAQDTARGTRDDLLSATALVDSLAQFFEWVDNSERETPEGRMQVLTELSETLPRAIEVTLLLSNWVRHRRSAFTFPEFLTSFEEGGHSQYDIDIPGKVGALEGYFKITRAAGSSIEAEDVITEERVWPVSLPPEVAALLDRPYVINLELVRTQEGWDITDCGFAYPPGTEL